VFIARIVTVLEIVPQSDHMDWGGAFKEITVTCGVTAISMILMLVSEVFGLVEPMQWGTLGLVAHLM
jgi:hypothetical protein